MSAMIERVAKAIWLKRCELAMHHHGIELELWGDGTVPKANHIFDEARAAIEAIREPPDGLEKIVYHGDYGDDVWRDMIDTALA